MSEFCAWARRRKSAMRASPTDDNAAYDDSSQANETLIFDWILKGKQDGKICDGAGSGNDELALYPV